MEEADVCPGVVNILAVRQRQNSTENMFGLNAL